MRQFRPASRPPARGVSLLEFAVVAAIACLLIGTLLHRMARYQEQAEQAAIASMAGALRAALSMKVGQLHARGKEHEIAALAGQNPVLWLSAPPPNYLG